MLRESLPAALAAEADIPCPDDRSIHSPVVQAIDHQKPAEELFDRDAAGEICLLGDALLPAYPADEDRDHSSARVLRAARDRAKAVQMFTTDYGDHPGDHRLMFKGAEQCERTTRVPMAWSDPGNRISVCTGSIGQILDPGTTILDRASIEPAVGMRASPRCPTHSTLPSFSMTTKKPAGFADRPRVHAVCDLRRRE